MISLETTVRDVVVQIPESTRVFERLNIDYCCGGNRPLMDACDSAGVEVDAVIEMLTALDQPGATQSDAMNFQKLSLAELINHILETHHVFTKSELDRIKVLTDKVLGAHGDRHPELLKVSDLFQRLSGDLKLHMFKEEQVLFPYIVKMENADTQGRPFPSAPFGAVRNPVRMMTMEHDAAGEILRELRAVTSDYRVPPDGCMSYQTLYQALENLEKDLHQHIHLENNILFPKAVEVEAR